MISLIFYLYWTPKSTFRIQMIRMIILLFIITFTYAQDDLRNCPTNLVRNTALRAHNGKCYEFIIHHHKDWAHARDDCASKGGNLVVIRNSDENNFIMTSLRSLNFAGQAWIGLTDQRVEGQWQWVTGEQVTFTFWGVNQPGILHNQEDCVVFKYSDSGHWHDYPCTGFLLLQEIYPWICEYKQTTFDLPTPPTTVTPEPPTPPTTERTTIVV